MSLSEPVYLHRHLAPLAAWLSDPCITDIYVNRAGEAWLERSDGEIERVEVEELSGVTLERLARQIAAFSSQGISREYPILSATLPDGARAQIVMPPATRGEIAFAVRKHVVVDRRLEDYEREGAFTGGSGHAPLNAVSSTLERDGPAAALRLAVQRRCNILISGGTSTGKTTFLNALLAEVPAAERLVLIEDTPELQIHQPNAVGLLASRSELCEARTSTDDLLNAALRMRPDRIILGEIRGSEAFTFLRAINTGHPGSMSTIHADSPERALEQLALLVLQTGTQLRREDVLAYVRSIVDVFVQLDRGQEGRQITDVRLRELKGPS